MSADETLVIAVSVLLVSLGSLVVAPFESVALWFILVVGIGIVGPQCYLAATDDEVPARVRVRVAIVLAMIVAILGTGSATAAEHRSVALATAALFVGVVCYEFADGYRSPRAS